MDTLIDSLSNLKITNNLVYSSSYDINKEFTKLENFTLSHDYTNSTWFQNTYHNWYVNTKDSYWANQVTSLYLDGCYIDNSLHMFANLEKIRFNNIIGFSPNINFKLFTKLKSIEYSMSTTITGNLLDLPIDCTFIKYSFGGKYVFNLNDEIYIFYY